ncbi:hypothetical protein [Actinocrispum sp. NPDC049592]|uniref:hypothetical protein n=1 Tax=Actinocrispum sp. NPDC049592 TaxID=3154835 RepID=UPI003431B854
MSRFEESEEPEDLTAWLHVGFRRVEAKAWRRWNFDLNEAVTWLKSGIREALTAAQWQAAGATPATVKEWMKAGISPNDAVRWHEFGYTLEQAREHVKEGRGPVDAYEQRMPTSMRFTASGGGGIAGMVPVGPDRQHIQRFLNGGVPQEVIGGYLERRWLDDEAYAWAKQGVHATDARIWCKIGLIPAETKDLSNPLDVIEEWWRAGIPFDEVADWLGAGLTAAEAVEQKAAGVTREQAAALRALRRGNP